MDQFDVVGFVIGWIITVVLLVFVYVVARLIQSETYKHCGTCKWPDIVPPWGSPCADCKKNYSWKGAYYGKRRKNYWEEKRHG